MKIFGITLSVIGVITIFIVLLIISYMANPFLFILSLGLVCTLIGISICAILEDKGKL